MYVYIYIYRERDIILYYTILHCLSALPQCSGMVALLAKGKLTCPLTNHPHMYIYIYIYTSSYLSKDQTRF